MLLGELADVFRVAVGDYHRFQMEQLIRRTILALSWKGTPESYAYPDEAYRLKADADLVIEDQHDLLRTGRAKTVFEASLFANLLPGEIARQIRSFLTVDIALSAPSTEAQFLLLRFQSAKALIENFVQIANGLGAYPFKLPRDQITLSLRLPPALFGSDLARLGDTLKAIDDFFGAVAEETSGARSRPTFQYAADQALTLYLSIEPRQALPVMSLVRACLQAARSAVGFEGALEEMRKAQVPPDTLDQMARTREATTAVELTRGVEAALLETADTRLPAGRPRDAARLARLCLRMARYMEQGLEIHLMRPMEPSSATLLSAEPVLGPADINRAVAAAISSQAELNGMLETARPMNEAEPAELHAGG